AVNMIITEKNQCSQSLLFTGCETSKKASSNQDRHQSTSRHEKICQSAPGKGTVAASADLRPDSATTLAAFY
ncbi:MAG: hypothetical protein ACKO2S_08675, partial [Burkholderiaceae bacterium]